MAGLDTRRKSAAGKLVGGHHGSTHCRCDHCTPPYHRAENGREAQLTITAETETVTSNGRDATPQPGVTELPWGTLIRGEGFASFTMGHE